MPLFEIPKRSKSDDNALLKKASNKKKAPVTKNGGGIASIISTIRATIDRYLGKYADYYETIRDEDRLADYITTAIEQGIIAIDTETTGLDPLLDDIVGISIFTDTEKPAYIPIGHISYVSGLPSKNQMKPDVVARQFQRLADAKTLNVMFNGPFDVRVIYNHIGVWLECGWDCYLGARCLNENEESNALKKLHQKYVLKGKEDEFKFDELFKGVNFAYVPISTAYLYAAHDARVTLEYYKYQVRFLGRTPEEAREDLRDVSWVFHNIEMPCVSVVADIENNGIAFDLDYAQKLSVKYHKILDDKLENFKKVYSMYQDEIDSYTGNIRLDDPININSVPQLQALLYDIIGIVGPIDKKTKKPTRSTGEDTLKALKHPVADAILEYREFSTIVSTFIDKLPNCVNPNDGRIHCKFNQYGADTGRFSSSDPNLQNIPSHNKDIRKMFKATDGYVLMSADYSQQEPKCMTMMCQDELMIDAYNEGKDLYAQIAAMSFNKTYRECLEFQTNEDGSYVLDKDGERITYPDGKERRSQAKSILLGVLYSRGVPSIAEQLNVTTKKAQAIKDSVFVGFPTIKEFEEDSVAMAEELGYVTTLWGRKRRLPIMQRPDYEFEWAEGAGLSDDPLNFDDEEVEDEVPDNIVNKYIRQLNRVQFRPDKKMQIIDEAKAEGIIITDNSSKRADATRKCVNARIQGSAADMSKLAMIKLYNDERLRELGFRILIPVHDEFIAECPIENARECKERFERFMSEAPAEKFTIPISCDVEVFDRWYGEKVEI